MEIEEFYLCILTCTVSESFSSNYNYHSVAATRIEINY